MDVFICTALLEHKAGWLPGAAVSHLVDVRAELFRRADLEGGAGVLVSSHKASTVAVSCVEGACHLVRSAGLVGLDET